MTTQSFSDSPTLRLSDSPTLRLSDKLNLGKIAKQKILSAILSASVAVFTGGVGIYCAENSNTFGAMLDTGLSVMNIAFAFGHYQRHNKIIDQLTS